MKKTHSPSPIMIVRENSSQIHFISNKEIVPKLSRAKAKLKFINVNQKHSYEKHLKSFTSRDSLSMYNEEDYNVFDIIFFESG